MFQDLNRLQQRNKELEKQLQLEREEALVSQLQHIHSCIGFAKAQTVRAEIQRFLASQVGN